MRRLLLLTIAALLGWAALRLLGEATPIPAHAVRDAGLVAAAAVALAAWAALGPYPAAAPAQSAWPNIGRSLFGAGVATALVGGLLAALELPAPWNAIPAWVVWGVGLALLVAGALWRGPVVRYPAPIVRWERDARGRFVRRPAQGQAAADFALAVHGRRWWAALASLLLLAALLRLLLVWNLPPVCQGAECVAVLAGTGAGTGAGAEAGTGRSLLMAPLARLLSTVTGDPLRGLRLAAALVSLLWFAVLLGALRRWTSSAGVLVGGALAGLALPFVLPMPAAGAWAELPLWVALAAWGAAAGTAAGPVAGGRRAWTAAGIGLGLAAVAAPELSAAWLAWLVVAAAQTLIRRPRGDFFVLVGAALAAAALTPARLDTLLAPLRSGPSLDLWMRQGAELLHTTAAQTPHWIAGLVLVGLGALLRARGRGAALLLGTAALLFVLLRADLAALGFERALLPLMAPAALAAALAADQFLRAAIQAAPHAASTAVRAAPLLGSGLLLVALLALPPVIRTARTPQSVAIDPVDGLALAVASYIAESPATGADGAPAPVLLVPPGTLNHPAVRLAAGQALEQGRVATYTPHSNLPYRQESPAGIVYLLPATDRALLDELRRIYPEGTQQASGAPNDEVEGISPLAAYAVDGAALFDSLGLAQFVYAGPDWGSADEAVLSIGVGPLAFEWGTAPPLAPPFSVEWSGVLVIDTAGDHSFALEAPPGALVNFLLDGRLLLDTSAGLTSHSETLPAGLYEVRLRYRSGDAPGDFAILWQPPGRAELSPIPRTALHNPALPPAGLLGTYTAGAAWNGAVLAERKDRLIGADPILPVPYGVAWQGLVAAPRAGEYLFGVVSNGTVFLDVAGEGVASQVAGGATGSEAAGAFADGPAEGAIYLTAGWHPIALRFAATEAVPPPEVKLYWQPPGHGPEALRSLYLRPFGGAWSAADAPLPPLNLPDERYGGAEFALTTDASFWQPQVRIPPRDLPPLPFERVAESAPETAACGPEITQLAAPHGLAFDPTRGLLYAADTGNRRVVAWVVEGGALTSPQVVPLDELEEPVDVAVDAQGRLLVLDTVAPRLLRYDPATGAAERIALGEGFYRPRALAVDALGLIYVADTGGGRIAVVDETGAVSAEFGGRETPFGRGQPAAVATTPRALWAVAADHGRLWQLNTLGSYTALQPTSTIDGPHLAALPGDDPATAGRLFLSDPARARVLLLGADGAPLGALADAGAFVQPTGIATWQTGDLLFLAVSDTAACRVTLWQARADLLP